jgi:hypothetical protein
LGGIDIESGSYLVGGDRLLAAGKLVQTSQIPREAGNCGIRYIPSGHGLKILPPEKRVLSAFFEHRVRRGSIRLL